MSEKLQEARSTSLYSRAVGAPISYLAASFVVLIVVNASWPWRLGFGWRVLLTSFVLLPILEYIFGNAQLSERESTSQFADSLFLLNLLKSPVLLIFLFYQSTQYSDIASPGELVVTAAGVGVFAGATILSAHELCHRGSRWTWHVAEIVLTLVLYPCWCVEHVYGHHSRVGTPNDPATARRGEPVHKFVFRSVRGGVGSFVKLEKRRRDRKGIRAVSLRNRCVRYSLMNVAVLVCAWLLSGAAGVMSTIVSAVVAVALLETVNYIEHYGLTRQRRSDGSYEPVAAAHSWDSYSVLTNLLLFNVGRHAHHHLASRQAYQHLRSTKQAPQMPYGYHHMLLLAWIPHLWFRTMDHRLPAAHKSAIPGR